MDVKAESSSSLAGITITDDISARSLFISPQLPPLPVSLFGLQVERSLAAQPSTAASSCGTAHGQRTEITPANARIRARVLSSALVSPQWSHPLLPHWRAASCLFQQASLDTPNAFDGGWRLHQGGIDSCWALAAVISLRSAQPRILKQTFGSHGISLPDGRVQLQLYIAGLPCRMTLDGFLPVHPTSRFPAFASLLHPVQQQTSGATPAGHGVATPPAPPCAELWASYLEKGTAQACARGYGGLVQGHARDAFRLLSGAPVVTVSVPGGVSREEELVQQRRQANAQQMHAYADVIGEPGERLWRRIMQSLSRGGAIGASCGEAAPLHTLGAGGAESGTQLQLLTKWGLKPDHAYALLGAGLEGGQGGARWVQLCDPWQGGQLTAQSAQRPAQPLVGACIAGDHSPDPLLQLPWSVFCAAFRHIDLCAPPARWVHRAAVQLPASGHKHSTGQQGAGADSSNPRVGASVQGSPCPASIGQCLLLQPAGPCAVTAVVSRRSGRLRAPEVCGDGALVGSGGLGGSAPPGVGGSAAGATGEAAPCTPDEVAALVAQDVKRAALHRPDVGLCLFEVQNSCFGSNGTTGEGALSGVHSPSQLAVVADCPRSFDEWVNLHGSMLRAGATYMLLPVSCALLSACMAGAVEQKGTGGEHEGQPPHTGRPPKVDSATGVVGSTHTNRRHCALPAADRASPPLPAWGLGPVPLGQDPPLPSPSDVTLEAHCSEGCVGRTVDVPPATFACALLARVQAVGVHSYVFEGGAAAALGSANTAGAADPFNVAPAVRGGAHRLSDVPPADAAQCFHKWLLRGDAGFWLAVGNTHPTLHLRTVVNIDGGGDRAEGGGTFNVTSSRGGAVYEDSTPPGCARLLCCLTQDRSDAPFGFQYVMQASVATREVKLEGRPSYRGHAHTVLPLG